jgi:GNAT superfamily N-acetyltransferase
MQALPAIIEKYTINDKMITFRTLDENDMPQMLYLFQKYQYANATIDHIHEMYYGDKSGMTYFIGIFDGKVMIGYTQIKIDDSDIIIEWFCSDKGYGTTLFKFVYNYTKQNGFNGCMVLTASLKDKYAVRRINFWYKNGFQTTKIDNRKNILHMIKC